MTNLKEPQESLFHIRFIDSEADKGMFWNLIEECGLLPEREYYERCFERRQEGELDIVIGEIRDGGAAGFCLLNWVPKYALFRKLEIPEIQDLNVRRSERKKGLGQAIILFCEDAVRAKGRPDIGIGVGLDSRFGAAQRLYARLGYIPDGSGVSYDRKQIACGEVRPVDENLCLMMTKSLF